VPSPTRHAPNETLFRSVNEQIARLSTTLAVSDEPGFVCECANLECSAQLSVSLGEYHEMRARDRQYVVLKEHKLDPTIERVIRLDNEFAVVEKMPFDERANASS
jgi:hypothetical protein